MKISPTPDPDDPLKVRRVLAFACAWWAAVPFPIIIALLVCILDLDKDIASKLIIYQGAIAAGPVGAYLYAAHKQQNAVK